MKNYRRRSSPTGEQALIRIVLKALQPAIKDGATPESLTPIVKQTIAEHVRVVRVTRSEIVVDFVGNEWVFEILDNPLAVAQG